MFDPGIWYYHAEAQVATPVTASVSGVGFGGRYMEASSEDPAGTARMQCSGQMPRGGCGSFFPPLFLWGSLGHPLDPHPSGS